MIYIKVASHESASPVFFRGVILAQPVFVVDETRHRTALSQNTDNLLTSIMSFAGYYFLKEQWTYVEGF